MTPDRAKQLIENQKSWPKWGSYSKYMSEDEVAYVRELFMNDPSGAVTVASIIQRIANGEFTDASKLAAQAQSDAAATPPNAAFLDLLRRSYEAR